MTPLVDFFRSGVNMIRLGNETQEKSHLFTVTHEETNDALEKALKEWEVETKDINRDCKSQEGTEGNNNGTGRNVLCIKIECDET